MFNKLTVKFINFMCLEKFRIQFIIIQYNKHIRGTYACMHHLNTVRLFKTGYILIYVCMYVAIYVYVTGFVKRGLIHASNFSNLRRCNSACS